MKIFNDLNLRLLPKRLNFELKQYIEDSTGNNNYHYTFYLENLEKNLARDNGLKILKDYDQGLKRPCKNFYKRNIEHIILFRQEYIDILNKELEQDNKRKKRRVSEKIGKTYYYLGNDYLRFLSDARNNLQISFGYYNAIENFLVSTRYYSKADEIIGYYTPTNTKIIDFQLDIILKLFNKMKKNNELTEWLNFQSELCKCIIKIYDSQQTKKYI